MFFIIKTGYSPNDIIRIDDMRDLEKAQYGFITNSKVVFNNGEVCRGQDIISIREDWHREMGWNKSFRDNNGDVVPYELGDDDWKDIKIKGIDEKYRGVLAATKEKVQYLQETGQAKLIGTGVQISLPERPKEILEGVDALANKFKI
jgi:hypothetical protein